MDRMPGKISFMFEIAGRCNQRCTFCYNSWRSGDGAVKRELATAETVRVIERLVDETPCHSIALSGGEPLLRMDIFEIISFAKKKGTKVCLVSNGVLLSEETIHECLSCGLDVFQISLLSDKPDVHDRLTGVAGFDKAVNAIFDVKKAGGRVHVFFVGTADNIESFRGVLELCVLVGVDHVSLGRFLPGGAGLAGWEASLPNPEMIDRALETAEECARKYGLSISVANPIPPCLNDISKYPRVRFGFCGVGNPEHAFFAVDPEGNLKVCSHSPVVLGNLLENSFAEIVANSFLDEFDAAVPEFCRDCGELSRCRGGCRSSAHVCYGSPACEDPYLARWKARARKPTGSLVESRRVACEEVP